MDLIDRIIAREGGATITNDPSDPGKLTKYGISQSSHPGLDIANLTYDQAKDIYIQEYYVGNNLQLLPENLREYVMDFCVHSGASTAIRYLQKLVGQTQDGILGPKTTTAIKSLKLDDIIRAYTRERVLFLARQVVNQPTKAKYLVGWLNRVLSI